MKFSLIRAKILSIIQENEPISISELAKKTGISTGNTIYRYIEELQERGLITIKKDTKKRGQPSFISTTSKAKPISSKLIQNIESLKEAFTK